jgi:formate dehydrogenase
MPFNVMTPHISGSSLSAEARYSASTLDILQIYFGRTPHP